MDYQRGSLVNTDSGKNVYCANGLNWILISYPSLRRNWTLCLNYQCWHFEGVFFSNVVIRYRGAGANEKESQKIIETKQTVITIAIKKEKKPACSNEASWAEHRLLTTNFARLRFSSGHTIFPLQLWRNTPSEPNENWKCFSVQSPSTSGSLSLGEQDLLEGVRHFPADLYRSLKEYKAVYNI